MAAGQMNRRASSCFAVGLLLSSVAAAQDPEKPDPRPALEITQDTSLDPAKTYGPIVIKASNITIDGRGAWVVGARQGDPKDFKNVGIAAKGVSNVTLRNVRVKGWDIGLRIEQGGRWRVEDCDFSDNFHYPEAGWGELGQHGGIVLENADHCTLRKNKANRVWDALQLVESNDNLIEENDFSHASNTCARLWTACRNRFLKNNLSWGIRIKPGEVHARDSAGVLLLACSNDNYFADNDVTHGGDGVFLRPSGGPSSGNLFERNDASYANNNCFEAQCPRNAYRRNKANHGSHGIWIGLSNESIVEENEVCYNGLPSGMHNAPWTYRYVPKGPQSGAGGIIMLGWCNHTVCRGNKVIGNNGAGICMAVNAPPTQPLRVFHWVIEHNTIRDNRWGIYMENVDWIDIAGNIMENNRDGDILQGGDNKNITVHGDNPKITRSPTARLIPPARVKPGEPIPMKLGQQFVLDASGSSEPDGHPLSFRWDFHDGTTATGPRVTHAFTKVGPYSPGVTVTNGRFSDLAYCDFLAYEDVSEPATEGRAADWSWEQLEGRDYGWHVPRGKQPSPSPVKPAATPTTKVEIGDDRQVRLVGNASLHVCVAPGSENAVRLLYPRSKDAGITLTGKTSLVFWVKMLNNNIHAWKGLMPTVVIHESPSKFCLIRPNDDPENWEGGIDWIHRTVPLRGNAVWQVEGDVPATMNWMTIEFFPWGVGKYQFWLDGMALK
jgi:parallel beta-helix repeat protein